MQFYKYLLLFLVVFNLQASEQSTSSSSSVSRKRKRVPEQEQLSDDQKKAKSENPIMPSRNIFTHLQDRQIGIKPPRSLYSFVNSLQSDTNIIAIAISPDQTKLASISENDLTIKIWDLNSFELIKTVERHQANPQFISFADNQNIFCLDSSGIALSHHIFSGIYFPIGNVSYIEDLDENQLIKDVLYIKPSMRDNYPGIDVLTVDKYGMLRKWTSIGFSGETSSLGQGTILDSKISNDGKFIVSRSEDNFIHLYSVIENRYVTFYNERDELVLCTSTTFSPDSNYFALAEASNGKIYIINLSEDRYEPVFSNGIIKKVGIKKGDDNEDIEVEQFANIVDMAFSLDNKNLIMSLDTGDIKIIDLDKNETIFHDYAGYYLGNQKREVAKNITFFDNDNKFLFTLGNEIQFWSK